MKSPRSAWGAYSLQIPQPLKVHLPWKPTTLYGINCLNLSLILDHETPGCRDLIYTLVLLHSAHSDCLRSIPLQRNWTWLSSQCANELCLFLTFGCLFYQISLSHSSHCFLFPVLEHSLSCIFYPPESNVCLFPNTNASSLQTASDRIWTSFLPLGGSFQRGGGGQWVLFTHWR